MSRFDAMTKFLLFLLVVGIWGLLLRPLFTPAPALAEPAQKGGQKFDEITVQRLNVVDPAGKVQLVLSNADRMPDAIVKGKEYKRIVKPAGMLFFDPRGDECGGIGVAENKESGRAIVALDYAMAEAIWFGKFESKDGKSYSAQFAIRDRASLDVSPDEAYSKANDRIILSNVDRNSRLVLADAEGKDRIVMSVNAAGEAKFQILDKQGKVVFAAPQ
jgi:hypothetical protein